MQTIKEYVFIIEENIVPLLNVLDTFNGVILDLPNNRKD